VTIQTRLIAKPSTSGAYAPSVCGIDRRNPTFAPDAVIITLFGPGEPAIANYPKARIQGSMANQYAVKAPDHPNRNGTFVNDYNVLVNRGVGGKKI